MLAAAVHSNELMFATNAAADVAKEKKRGNRLKSLETKNFDVCHERNLKVANESVCTRAPIRSI